MLPSLSKSIPKNFRKKNKVNHVFDGINHGLPLGAINFFFLAGDGWGVGVKHMGARETTTYDTESVEKTNCNMVVTYNYVDKSLSVKVANAGSNFARDDEIFKCDHLNESYRAVLSRVLFFFLYRTRWF